MRVPKRGHLLAKSSLLFHEHSARNGSPSKFQGLSSIPVSLSTTQRMAQVRTEWLPQKRAAKWIHCRTSRSWHCSSGRRCCHGLRWHSMKGVLVTCPHPNHIQPSQIKTYQSDLQTRHWTLPEGGTNERFSIGLFRVADWPFADHISRTSRLPISELK